jgi:regulator of CtrA degradation
MALTPNLNPRIIEALYAEALVLAEEVRAVFDRLRQGPDRRALLGSNDDPEADLAQVQLSCEALRTTTRIMHCLAWLLNHRAYFAGELSELQLRRHGRLIANFPLSDPVQVLALPGEAQRCVQDSERLYARIQRLENAWRGEAGDAGSAIERLRQRLAAAIPAAV